MKEAWEIKIEKDEQEAKAKADEFTLQSNRIRSQSLLRMSERLSNADTHAELVELSDDSVGDRHIRQVRSRESETASELFIGFQVQLGSLNSDVLELFSD